MRGYECPYQLCYNVLNDIRVENSFIKTGYSDCKRARSTEKGFHQEESWNNHQQAILRLIEIPKCTVSTDVSEMVKSDLTDVQSQNRALSGLSREMAKILISNSS